MNITLNSSEAQTLYNTGRLIRTVDCDWQPPEDVRISVSFNTGCDGKWCVEWMGGNPDDVWRPVEFRLLEEPLESGAVYDVKEPCELGWNYIEEPSGKLWCRMTVVTADAEARYVRVSVPDADRAVLLGTRNPQSKRNELAAEEMPDWAIRQQATPTYKLVFEEGKLRWYEDLTKV